MDINKNRGKTPNMDGLYCKILWTNGMIWGVLPLFLETSIYIYIYVYIISTYIYIHIIPRFILCFHLGGLNFCGRSVGISPKTKRKFASEKFGPNCPHKEMNHLKQPSIFWGANSLLVSGVGNPVMGGITKQLSLRKPTKGALKPSIFRGELAVSFRDATEFGRSMVQQVGMWVRSQQSLVTKKSGCWNTKIPAEKSI